MNLAAARVAPEKAVIRPALPMRLSAGLIGTAMATLTYKQQLLHPNWQRKRLEILQRDEFVCQCCYDDQSTLHVHHKRYVRGRMAWEYPDSELVTLCEGCHETMHATSDAAKAMLAALPVDGPGCLSNVVGVLAGFATGEQGMDFHEVYADEPHHYLVGQVANRLMWAMRTPALAPLLDALTIAPNWVVRSAVEKMVSDLHARKDEAPSDSELRAMDGASDL